MLLRVVDTLLSSFVIDPGDLHSQAIFQLTQYLVRQNVFIYLGRSLEVMVWSRHNFTLLELKSVQVGFD